MRLDIDARFIPFAVIIWISSLLISTNQVLVFALLGLIYLGIILTLKKLNGNTLLLILSALVAILATTSHSSNKYLEEISPGIPVKIEVKVASDISRAKSGNIGIYREEDKYVVLANTYRVEEQIENAAQGFEYKSKIELRFADLDKSIEYGSKLVIKGKLEKYDFHNITYTINVEDYELIQEANLLDRAINKLRNNFLTLTRNLDGEASQLLPGLILGDTRNQSISLAQDMKNSGLTHLTAVSGGNIAILLLAIIWISQKFKFRLRNQVLVGLISLTLFALLVRTEPSVVRASFMGAISLLGLFNGTRRHGISALSLTICVSILIDPSLSVSWGFSLSVFATLGLLLFTRKFSLFISKSFPRIPEALAILIAVALSAQVSTAALIAGFSGQITLWSVPANLLTAPVIPFVTILGYLSLLLSNFYFPLAYLFAWAAGLFANWIGLVAHYFAAKQSSVIQVPQGIIGFLLVNFLLLTGYLIVFFNHNFQLISKIQILVLIAIVCVTYLFLNKSNSSPWPLKNWQFVMCDVGQGDGLILKDLGGKILVVDVGPNGKLMNDCLRKLDVKTIDALILTHFHADHVEGFELVKNRHEIKAVYMTWVEVPIYEVKKIRELLNGFKTIQMKAGDSLKVGDINIKCLWPTPKKMTIGSIPNNASIVNLVTIKNASFLLTGDIEPPAQEAIRNLWKIPQIDVVKVPHHGSKFQDSKFPLWTRARLALISVGEENSYGHPSEITIDLYKDSGMQVLSTDEVGSIAIEITDDDSILVSTQD